MTRNTRLMRHEQAWARVNALVDKELVELVELLNGIPGLQTVQSCQGDSEGERAYVYFTYGDWGQLCAFVFSTLEPALRAVLHGDGILAVEAFGGSLLGKLTFSPEATEAVTSGLRSVLTNDRS